MDSLKAIMDDLAGYTPVSSRKGACKWCGCFLSVHREDPTAFHIRTSSGRVEYVILYHGVFVCRACHRFQNEA